MPTCALRVLLLAALAAAGVTAPSAGAYSNVMTNSHALSFDGNDLELNTTTITLAGDVFTVTDPTSILFASHPCQQVDDHTATCPRAPDPVNVVFQIYVFLGGMDDSVTINVPLETHVDGEDGNDTITFTGNSMGILSGGAGDDVLVSGPGESWLDGGPGNDRLTDGGGILGRLLGGDGDDVIAGGGGRDCLRGDAGNDTVDGGADRDAVSGGDGDDLLRGGDGPDLLRGYGGRDRMLGGAGPDLLGAKDGTADRVTGGPGRDQATLDPRLDTRAGIESAVSQLQGVSRFPRC